MLVKNLLFWLIFKLKKLGLERNKRNAAELGLALGWMSEYPSTGLLPCKRRAALYPGTLIFMLAKGSLRILIS